jgi:osmotically-inducible protein OsmY
MTKTDFQRTQDIDNALRWDPKHSVQISVSVLEAEVNWNFERDAVENAVRYLTGVVSVHNTITLKPTNSIHIDTASGKVTLTGHASSWRSIADAESAAWAVPGVTEVVDHVETRMSY